MRWLQALTLMLLASAAHGIDAQFNLLLDLDNNPNTGCDVPTPAGTFAGAEAILTTFVATDGLDAANVTGVERRDCIDPATNSFAPPQTISAGGWPVGIGNGQGGFNVIETFLPVSIASQFDDIRLGLVATDELGNSSVLLASTAGFPIILQRTPPVPVPMLTGVVLLAVAMLLLLIGLVVISRRGRLTLTALVCLAGGGVAGAACVLDGEIFNWDLADLLAETIASDPNNGVDIRALFGKRTDGGAQLCFRIDAALVFANVPVAADDAYTTIETQLLDVAAGDGLLANDTLGIPEAVLVSFGGGNLGGMVTDHAAGASVAFGDGNLTVNADGSFEFQAETGFEGDFVFDYRIDNAAGDSQATVTIEVQTTPEAIDDAFETTTGELLEVPAPGVLANDSGLPEPTAVSFGGGDLGGAVGDHAAGSTVSIAPDGEVTLNADGSLSFTPPTGLTGPFGFDYRIENAAGDAQATITITVNDPPEITSADSHTCEVGANCEFGFSADGFPDPTITLDGTLPDGVTFNAATESLEGIPVAGTGAEYGLTVTANNGINPEDTQAFTLTVNEPPTITSDDNLTCEVGSACDFNFTADGFPDPTFDLPGLPDGLTLDPVSGELTGEPDAGTGGVYNLVLEAENAIDTDTQNFTLTIGQAPAITSPASLTCEVGTACSFTATADGFPDPTFDLPGLPDGLTLDPVTGELSGTPDAGTGAVYNLVLEADNDVGTDTQNFTLTVNEAPLITSADELSCEVGEPCNFQFAADGHPDPTFDLPGLPDGLSLDPVSGELTGEPDAGTGGVYNLVLEAENVVDTDAQNFTLTIGQPPAITSPASLTCEVGTACSFTATATGFPDPTFDLPGLPDGLTLDPVTGELSGTPDAGTGAVYNLVLEADNDVGTDTQNFTLTVNEAPLITSADELSCEVGEPCNFQFAADGHPDPTFDLPGLPSGLSLDPVSGELSGEPDAGTGGVYNLVLEAENSVDTDTQNFTLTIGQAPVITSPDNHSCEAGSSCSFTFSADGEPAPTFSLPGLPPSLSLNATTGELSGVPDAGTGGVYNLTLTATNTAGSDDQAFELTVTEAPQANNDPSGGIPSDSSPGSMPYHGSFDSTLVVSDANGVLANDTLGFPEADIVDLTPISANGGDVTLNPDGGFSYSPPSGFTGIDTFEYCLDNGVNPQDCATVSMAIGERPDADDHLFAQTLLGNTHIDTALSSNFSLLTLTSGDAVSLAVSGQSNGDAAINGTTGTFSFNPAAGHNGAAAFQYSVTNGFGNANGTVTFDVQGLVWYFDNGAAAGDGRLASPFNSLAEASAAADGDVLFLHTGSGDYTGGITLLNNQTLVGHGSADDLEAHAGQAAPDDSPLPTTSTAPVIANAGGHGIVLGSGNGLHGLHVGNTSGYGVIGNGFGTLTVSGVSITGSGSGLNLDSGTVAGAGFDQVNATTGTHGILLIDVAGTVNLGAGAISGATTAAMEINGGTANINYAGSLQPGTGGRPALIQNKSGGTVALTGALNSTQLGVHLANNTGATVNFSGSLNLSTGGNTAFQATGGGTITATGAGSTLATTTASALRVADTTIGAADLTFQSIGSSSGNATGIILNNTGSSGGLRVTGTGTAGSGGTIANKIGPDAANEEGIGIYLNQTANVSLSRMQLNDFGNYAILGQDIDGFEMTHTVINGSNGTNAGSETGDMNTGVDQGSVRLINLTGEALIANSTISGGLKDNFWVQNTSGTLDRIVFDEVTMGLHSTNDGNNSLRLIARGNSVFNATVQDSNFLGARGDQIDFRAESSGNAELTFSGNTLVNNHPSIATGGGGVTLLGGEAGLFSLTFENNTMRDAMGSALVLVKTIGSGNIVGTVANNQVGVATIDDSGSFEGHGIQVRSNGGGELTIAILNNEVYQYNNHGIMVQAGAGSVQGGVINANVIGNIIAHPGDNIDGRFEGLHLNSGVTPGDSFAVCFDAADNTLTDSGRDTVFEPPAPRDARLRQRMDTTVRLPDYTGGATDMAAVQAYLEGRNVTPFTGVHSAASTGFGGGAACFD